MLISNAPATQCALAPLPSGPSPSPILTSSFDLTREDFNKEMSATTEADSQAPVFSWFVAQEAEAQSDTDDEMEWMRVKSECRERGCVVGGEGVA